MKSLSSIGIGLSVVFGCLLLALVAELYYLLWWKNKKKNKIVVVQKRSSNNAQEEQERDRSCFCIFFFFCCCCWKNPILRSPQQHLCSSLVHENKENDISVPGPPRFLFTIAEETREDLDESEDGITSIKSRTLSDLAVNLETPYFTPPLTPDQQLQGHFGHFESSPVDDSPPPKLKFLRDAEEKLKQRRRRLMEQIEAKNQEDNGGRFIRVNIISDDQNKISQQKQEDKEEEIIRCYNHDHGRDLEIQKVLFPLISSPPTFKSTFQLQKSHDIVGRSI